MIRTNTLYMLEERDVILVTGRVVLLSSLCPQCRGHNYIFMHCVLLALYAAFKLMDSEANV
jgi:hypothetical protein